MRSEMISTCQAKRIQCIDALPYLSSALDRGERLYPTTTESHPNARGYLVIASAVKERLEQVGPLNCQAVKISVIIPVRNEEQSIGQLLNSLTSQTLKPAEIVITDGGSSDQTAAIIAAYDQTPVPIRLIRGGPGLPGRNRNLAAAQATNEWLAFIDAGIRPESTWLEFLAKRAQLHGEVDVVYGSYEPVADTLFKRCCVMAYVPPPVELEGQVWFVRAQLSPC